MITKLFDEIPYIEDGCIILRRMEESDAAGLKAMAEEGSAYRYAPAILFENRYEDKAEAIRQMYREPFEKKESLLLGVFRKDAPETLAGIAEFYNYDANWNKCSIGLRLSRPDQKVREHGIALMKAYLFEHTDVKRITAHLMTADRYAHMAFTREGFRLRKVNAPEDWGKPEPTAVNRYVLEKLGNIKYAKIGSGEKTMVILPGLAFKTTLLSADLVANAYGELFKDYTIYLFDDRSNIDPGYTIRERAGDIAAEMKTLGLRDAFVFGASMGGMTGQYLAIDHPELVKKLFITSTAPCVTDEARAVVGKWKRLIESGQTQQAVHESVKDIYSPAVVAQFGDTIESAIGVVNEKEQKDVLALINAILSFDCRQELGKIRCPVMVTGTYGDRVLFPEASKMIAELTGGELFMYGEEYGHAVYDEAPDFKQRILSFYEKDER